MKNCEKPKSVIKLKLKYPTKQNQVGEVFIDVKHLIA